MTPVTSEDSDRLASFAITPRLIFGTLRRFQEGHGLQKGQKFLVRVQPPNCRAMPTVIPSAL